MVAAQLGYSRLAGDDEVAPLVAQAAELLQPKRDEDEGGRAPLALGLVPAQADCPCRMGASCFACLFL